MRYLTAFLMLMLTGIASASLIGFDELETSGTGSAFWTNTLVGSGPVVEVRGVNDGLAGFVVVGTSFVADSAYTYDIYLDVKNVDLNDTFDYSLIAYTGVTPVSSAPVTLAPGASSPLVLSGVTYDGTFSYGVKIEGGDDIFVTELSNLRIVPEPMTVATLAVGSLVIFRRKRI